MGDPPPTDPQPFPPSLLLVVAACGDDDSADTDDDGGAAATEAEADTDSDSGAMTTEAEADTDGDSGAMTEATTAFDCAEVPEIDASGDLTVYSGRSEELVGPLSTASASATTSTSPCATQGARSSPYRSPRRATSTGADVFFSQTSGALGFLEGEGRLVELPAATLDQVAEEYRSPTGMWVGTSGRIRVFVHNTETCR